MLISVVAAYADVNQLMLLERLALTSSDGVSVTLTVRSPVAPIVTLRVRHSAPLLSVPLGGLTTWSRLSAKPWYVLVTSTRYPALQKAAYTPSMPLNCADSAAALQRASVEAVQVAILTVARYVAGTTAVVRAADPPVQAGRELAEVRAAQKLGLHVPRVPSACAHDRFIA